MQRKNKNGFTLLELLIAVAIIAILVAIALPRYLEATNRSKTNADKMNIRLINTQIELYQINTGYYPSYPGMPELLSTSSYFPEGAPECPFLKGNTTYPDPLRPSAYKLNVCSSYIVNDPAFGDDGTCVTWSIASVPMSQRLMRVHPLHHRDAYLQTHEGRWID